MPPASGAADPLDLLPDGVVVADAEGRVVVVNAMARRLLGPDARVGRPLREVMALADQEGCDWFGPNHPYDGLPSRVGITAWRSPSGPRGNRAMSLHASR